MIRRTLSGKNDFVIYSPYGIMKEIKLKRISMQTSTFIEWILVALMIVIFLPFIAGGFIIYKILVNEGFLLEED